MNRAIAHFPGLAGVLCASLVILSPASGAEFSWQVAGSFRENDASRLLESNRTSLKATYYLSPVDDEDGPYELAPFLNQSSYVWVSVAGTKLREELITAISVTDPSSVDTFPVDVPVSVIASFPPNFNLPTESGIDTSEYSIFGRYVWRGTGWYTGARLDRSDVDLLPSRPSVAVNGTREGSGLLAGKYFGTRTAVELSFAFGTQSQEIQQSVDLFQSVILPNGVPFPSVIVEFSELETETEDIILNVRHVGEAGDLTWSVGASIRSTNLETSIRVQPPTFIGFSEGFVPLPGLIINSTQTSFTELRQNEREQNYSVSGSLFPTRALGMHISYSRLDNDRFGSSNLAGVSASWFFVRNASAEIELLRAGFDRALGPGLRDSLDRDSVIFRLLGRF